MKKLIAAILILCLAFAAFAGVVKTDTAQTKFTSEKGKVDYKKIYALHSPDEVVAKLDGRDVTWEEFFYTYYTYAKNTEEYINQVNTYYGADIGWEEMEKADGSGESFSQGVKEYAQSFLAQYATVEKYCSEKGVALDAGSEKELDDILKDNIATVCGEGATEDDFNKALEEMYLPWSLYDRMMEDSLLSEKAFKDVYGENGEKLNDADVIKELEEMGYMHAAHILLSVIDTGTGETADEDTVNRKKAQAEEISKSFNEIKDNGERFAEFIKKAGELTDDGSVEYTFRSGYMIEDFESAVKTLKDYEVSEPVKTVYGYHVIMRLPIAADAQLMDQGVSGKLFCAQKEFGDEMNQMYDAMELKFSEDFNMPVITRYIK